NSKYIPYNNNKEYKPGDFFSATASIDLTKNRYYIAGDFTFTTYLDDKIDNLKIFRQSNQFVTRFRSGYNTSTTQTGFEILYIIRGDNKQYSTLNDIEIDPSKFFGNEFRINSKHTTFFADDWRLSPSVEWKYIGADDRGNASAHIFGFGWSVGRNIGKNNILEIGFRYFSGKANGGNIDLKGLEIMSSLTASF
ncbi:MAG: hypothetical protein ACE5D6_06505, partial [Candidatus Zixiibacteriota bacterium]